MLPRRLAVAGAAVLCIDHVPKSADNQGRYAIGGQRKLAAVDGAAFNVKLLEPLSRADLDPVEGRAQIRVAKDRQGFIRAHAVGDLVGDLNITAYPDGGVSGALDPPNTRSGSTAAQRRIVEHLKVYEGASKTDLRTLGNSGTIDDATRELIGAGHVQIELVGRSHRHHLTDAGRKLWLIED